jgi:hypothetical protein
MVAGTPGGLLLFSDLQRALNKVVLLIVVYYTSICQVFPRPDCDTRICVCVCCEGWRT